MATFDYFGESFAYADEWPEFEEAEFHAARADLNLDPALATGYALRLALACVAEEDRGRFREVSRKNRAKMIDWIAVYRDYTATIAEVPTGEPTDSSAGLENTSQKSESQPIASVTSLTEPEKPRLVRPDLALAAARSRTA